MEDSERRRERLKAMRTVAAQAEASSYVETSPVSGFLANPLLESPATLPAQEPSHATPRFDFYTDPMAAFSANKKKSTADNHAARGYFTPPSNSGSPMTQFSAPHSGGPRNPDMTTFPAHQMQSNYSPNQMMHQAQGPYNSAAPYMSPRAHPFPMHQGMPDAWSRSGGVGGHYSNTPHRGTSSPYPIHNGNPSFQPSGNPSFNYGQSRPPSPWFGNNPRPGLGLGGSYSHSGRGQGQWHGGSRSQVSGRNGGRGRGFHSRGIELDEALRPESFYDKSMVEDPWQHLEPVVWRGLDDPSFSNSWLPKSVSMKKPRVSESSNKSSSQQSLAEYLATSFNEAVNDAPNV